MYGIVDGIVDVIVDGIVDGIVAGIVDDIVDGIVDGIVGGIAGGIVGGIVNRKFDDITNVSNACGDGIDASSTHIHQGIPCDAGVAHYSATVMQYK